MGHKAPSDPLGAATACKVSDIWQKSIITRNNKRQTYFDDVSVIRWQVANCHTNTASVTNMSCNINEKCSYFQCYIILSEITTYMNYWICSNWIVQCFTSPPTQYRLYGRRFLQVKKPNQQYQSTEGKSTKDKSNNGNNTKHTCIDNNRHKNIHT